MKLKLRRPMRIQQSLCTSRLFRAGTKNSGAAISVRVTAIYEMIDPKWLPYLQTPPFPEYTSGHSTISATSSTVLTALFGANFEFHDNSDLQYIGMEKDFNSFEEAAA